MQNDVYKKSVVTGSVLERCVVDGTRRRQTPPPADWVWPHTTHHVHLLTYRYLWYMIWYNMVNYIFVHSKA